MDAIKKPQNGAGNSGDAASRPSVNRDDFACAEDYMAACLANGETVTLAEWPRNVSESIRIELGFFNGKPVLNMRIWSRGTDGAWRPSRNGLTLHTRFLNDLRGAVNNAYKIASRAGLFQSPDEREKALAAGRVVKLSNGERK